jgi:hypothetical protein
VTSCQCMQVLMAVVGCGCFQVYVRVVQVLRFNEMGGQGPSRAKMKQTMAVHECLLDLLRYCQCLSACPLLLACILGIRMSVEPLRLLVLCSLMRPPVP